MMDKQRREIVKEKCRERKMLRGTQGRNNCLTHPEREEVSRNRLREKRMFEKKLNVPDRKPMKRAQAVSFAEREGYLTTCFQKQIKCNQ